MHSLNTGAATDRAGVAPKGWTGWELRGNSRRMVVNRQSQWMVSDELSQHGQGGGQLRR